MRARDEPGSHCDVVDGERRSKAYMDGFYAGLTGGDGKLLQRRWRELKEDVIEGVARGKQSFRRVAHMEAEGKARGRPKK